MADWYETQDGIVNLDRAHVFRAEPANHGLWGAFVFFGTKRYALSYHASEKEAHNACRDVALGEIENDLD